jgi:selenocysteine lyase/cysteine desulfurase
MTDWSAIRALFPALEKQVYLNTAGGAPIPRRTAEAGKRYYEQSFLDGDIHWDDWLSQVEETRYKVARLINTGPTNVAFLSNCSSGLNIAAHMLQGRGGVLTVTDEFPSCTLPWMQLGYDVDFLDAGQDGHVPVDHIEAAVSEETGVLVISHVQYKSGFRHDLAQLGRVCRENDLAFVVDATQSFGALPIDFAGCGIDFFVTSSYKWITSGYGVAVLCVSDTYLSSEAFPAVGWRSAEDPYSMIYDRLDLSGKAEALEQGHPPFAGVMSLSASLDLVELIGMDQIESRILELTHYLHDKLGEHGIGVLSTTEPDHISGITIVDVPDPQARVAYLKKRGIVTSTRGDGIRVSVHYFNNREDIDRLIEELVPVLDVDPSAGPEATS